MDIGLAFLGILLFGTSVFMMLLILVQRGKGGGLTGALGGMGGQSAFGAKAGDVFTKITVFTAVIWIFLCMLTIAVFNPPPRDADPAKDNAPASTIGGIDDDESADDESAGEGASDEAGDSESSTEGSDSAAADVLSDTGDDTGAADTSSDDESSSDDAGEETGDDTQDDDSGPELIDQSETPAQNDDQDDDQ